MAKAKKPQKKTEKKVEPVAKKPVENKVKRGKDGKFVSKGGKAKKSKPVAKKPVAKKKGKKKATGKK